MRRLIALALFFGFVSFGWADVVYYRSGQSVRGLVVEEHRDRIVMNVEGKETPILRQEIEEIFYDDPERNYFYLGNQALHAGEFPMARGFFRKALQIYPEFQEAVDALGRLEDLERKKVSGFTLARSAASLLLEENWGFSLGTSGPFPAWPSVQGIKENSLAARSGLFLGDFLVSFWGESFFGFSPEEVAGALLGPSDSKVKLTIEREVSLMAEPSIKRWPGMQLAMERLGLTIVSVESQGVAQENHLRPGDRIVAIEGVLTRYIPLVQAYRMLEKARGKTVSLKIHRDLMIRRE